MAKCSVMSPFILYIELLISDNECIQCPVNVKDDDFHHLRYTIDLIS